MSFPWLTNDHTGHQNARFTGNSPDYQPRGSQNVYFLFSDVPDKIKNKYTPTFETKYWVQGNKRDLQKLCAFDEDEDEDKDSCLIQIEDEFFNPSLYLYTKNTGTDDSPNAVGIILFGKKGMVGSRIIGTDYAGNLQKAIFEFSELVSGSGGGKRKTAMRKRKRNRRTKKRSMRR